jgi:hypothetical protein
VPSRLQIKWRYRETSHRTGGRTRIKGLQDTTSVIVPNRHHAIAPLRGGPYVESPPEKAPKPRQGWPVHYRKPDDQTGFITKPATPIKLWPDSLLYYRVCVGDGGGNIIMNSNTGFHAQWPVDAGGHGRDRNAAFAGVFNGA